MALLDDHKGDGRAVVLLELEARLWVWAHQNIVASFEQASCMWDSNDMLRGQRVLCAKLAALLLEGRDALWAISYCDPCKHVMHFGSTCETTSCHCLAGSTSIHRLDGC